MLYTHVHNNRRLSSALSLVLIVALLLSSSIRFTPRVAAHDTSHPESVPAKNHLFPELVEGNSSMQKDTHNPFDLSSEPQGMLMDIGALETSLSEAPRQPDALDRPLVVSRSQTANRAADAVGGSLVITFTIRNKLPPANPPEVDESLSITDTIEALANFDYASDPNTIRNVLLVDKLTSNATFVSATPAATSKDGTYAWSLGDIPPMNSIEVGLKVQLAGTSADAVELDTGATAHGTLQGRAVSTTAIPAGLAPDDMGQWLVRTPDADIKDTYMLEKAAEVGGSPEQLFAYVRSLGYEAYTGSLRGTRGTLWSEAGNALDQSSLLIAMLRANGIPARYRHGTLSTAQAQTLIASMFPTPTRVSGHVPPDLERADPVNDPTLLAWAQDHWWVQAYIPGSGWTDMDPAFANADIGQSFATAATDGTDQIAEVPDAERHTVTLKVKAEIYDGVFGTSSETYALDATLNTVELIGEPAVLAYLVNQQSSSFMGFGGDTTTYRPYVQVGDRTIQGSDIQEALGNFGLTANIISGVWLMVDIRDPDGNVQSYDNTLFDRFGYAARAGGDDLSKPSSGNMQPFTTEQTAYSILFAPSWVPTTVVAKYYEAASDSAKQSQAAQEAMEQIDLEDETAAAEIRNVKNSTLDTILLSQKVRLLSYVSQSDEMTTRMAPISLVKPYLDKPRVLIAAYDEHPDTQTTTTRMDLMYNRVRTVLYPGQSWDGMVAFNYSRGMQEMSLEAALTQDDSDAPSVSVSAVFDTAEQQGIPIVKIGYGGHDKVNTLNISDEAKARIKNILQESVFRMVVVPESSITIAGQTTVGWLVLDVLTGETFDMMENGQHFGGLMGSMLRMDDFGAAEAEMALVGSLMGQVLYTVNFVVRRSLMPEENVCDAIINAANDTEGLAPNLFREDNAQDFVISGAFEAIAEAAKRKGDLLDAMAPMNIYGAFTDGIGLSTPFDLTLDSLGLPNPFKMGGFKNGVRILKWSLLADKGCLKMPGLQSTLAADDAPEPLAEALIAPPSTSEEIVTLAQANVAVTGSLPQGAVTGELVSNVAYMANASSTASASLYATASTGMAAGGAGTSYDITAFESTAAPTLSDATVIVGGPTSGTAQVGSSALDAPNGLAIAGYSGPLSVNEEGATTDRITLKSSGNVSLFTLNVEPATSSLNAPTPVQFQPTIAANFNDTFTVLAMSPENWHVAVADTGQVTATPPTGATPGDYSILVAAYPQQYPHLFVSAMHTITVNEYQDMSMTVTPDPSTTIPWGAGGSGMSETNNGRLQLTDAAFTIELSNNSNVAHTFDIAVSGLPEGWAVLSNAPGQTNTTLDLPAGEVGLLSLYISPTLTSAMPAAGTSHAFTVQATASANADLTASADATFTVPAISYAQLTVAPDMLTLKPDDSAELNITLRNVGNTNGSFPLAIDLPDAWRVDDLTQQATLDAGDVLSQTVTLHAIGGTLGETYPLAFSTQSGSYEQTASLSVRIASNHSECVAEASNTVNALTGATLIDALDDLETTIVQLDADMSNTTQRQAVIDAVYSVAEMVSLQPSMSAALQTLNASMQQLAKATNANEISSGLTGLCDPLNSIATNWTAPTQAEQPGEPSEQPTQQGVIARFAPGAVATRPGEQVSTVLKMTYYGDEATSYRVEFTAPFAGLPAAQTVELQPNEQHSIQLDVTPSDKGLYQIKATITPVDASGAATGDPTTVQASVNATDTFAQALAVVPEPPFVETGVSSTTLTAQIANIANVPLTIVAHTSIISRSGSVAWSGDSTLSLRTGDPSSYTLNTLDTSGFASGVYTVSVELRDEQGSAIPGSQSVGFLTVGQGLSASIATYPETVAPGTSTVAVSVTTRIHRSGILGETSGAQKVRRTPKSASHPIEGDASHPVGLKGAWHATRTYRAYATIRAVLGQAAQKVRRTPKSASHPMDDGLFPSTSSGSRLTPESPPVYGGARGENTDSLPIIPALYTLPTEHMQRQPQPAAPLASTSGIVRYEEDNASIVSSDGWKIYTTDRASSGGYAQSDTVGDVVSLEFTGTWVSVGFLTNSKAGYAEVFIDGTSQEVIDNYSRETDVASYIYDNLSAGTHTISVTVLGTSNPLASNTYIYLDYIDVWDGTDMPQGTFEQDDERVHRSSNWTEESLIGASGGSYISGGSNVWFPFTGDSVSFIAMSAASGASSAEVFIDGQSQGVITPTTSIHGFFLKPLSFDYTGLGDGLHMLHVKSIENTTVDAFAAPTIPEPMGPRVEWFTAADGVLSDCTLSSLRMTTPVVGDINNDGIPEMVVVEQNGWGNANRSFYVYRGDGQNTSNGTPLLWSVNLADWHGGQTMAAALADIDSNVHGSEIILATSAGVYAFQANGSLLWFNSDVSGSPNAASIANMDNDPEPEIVVGVNVIEADGTTAWLSDVTNFARPVSLADMTGDGIPDIISFYKNTLTLTDYGSNPAEPVQVWQNEYGRSRLGNFVAGISDIDGKQPGGDLGPEIVVVTDTDVKIIDADGTELQSYPHPMGGDAGGGAIADIDGDGEVEIIATIGGGGNTIFARNPDGSLLWSVPALDQSSGTNVSVFDLDGDGIMEVMWNGGHQGFTIYRGSDGQVLLNAPELNSWTFGDYPIAVDVDGDGHVEITTGCADTYIIGFDDEWASSRQVWNQYNYNITNINDDLTVPFVEPHSWEVHNTYRTQSPVKDAVPVYGVTIDHTLPVTGVEAIEESFDVSLSSVAPNLQWGYRQSSFERGRTTSFEARLLDMQPGEVRKISEGTRVTYSLPSGSNQVTLPPLYVSAARIIAINPVTQTASAGSAVAYNVELFNPGTVADTYALSVSGVPDAWVSLPAQATIAAGETKVVPLTLAVPYDADEPQYTITVVATTSQGGADQAHAQLVVEQGTPGVGVALTPDSVATVPLKAATYTLVVSNTGTVVDTYDVAVELPADWQYELLTKNGEPRTAVTLPANVFNSETLTLKVTPPTGTAAGSYPVNVVATSRRQAATKAEAQAQAVIAQSVAVQITPEQVSLQREDVHTWEVQVTNTGEAADTFDLWVAGIIAGNARLSEDSATLEAGASTTVQLEAGPLGFASPGTHIFAVYAQSQSNEEVQGYDRAEFTMEGFNDVVVAASPVTVTVESPDIASYLVVITNTGNLDDTYLLTASTAEGNIPLNLEVGEVYIPTHMTAGVLLRVPTESIRQSGSYDITVRASSNASGASDDDVAVLKVQAGGGIYLPLMLNHSGSR